MQNNQTSLPLIAAGDPLAQFFLPEDPCLPWWIATTVTLLALGFLWSRLLRMRLRLKSARQHSWNLQAVIIHEIRTPFCAISKLLELATQTHQLQTNTRELLTTAHHSARSLLVLMDDMLTQSKLETGKLVLTPQTVNLPALLNELARSYTPIATQKNLKFIIDVDCNPSSLKIDVLRLRQILSNILSNAIKFTPRGKIHIEVKSRPAHQPGFARVEIQVSDTGIGMSREALGELFTLFGAAGETSRQQYGGNGLGLYLCHQLTRLMHGKIHVDSQPERGTRLMLEFEFAVAPEPALPHPARPAFNGARALIADDDRANQMLLKRQLEQHGLTVSCCNNGIQGLRQWAKGKLDIIFCDMHMPELNGAELTRRIRSLERRLNKTPIPIIGVSADLSSPMAGSGVDYCLSKPTSAEDLASLLHQYLDTRPRPGEKKRVRFEVLHQLSQDDVEFERDFLDTVLKNNRDDLQKLRRAHEEQDRAQMAESLHRLKSMLRLLASDAIIKQCQTLEHAVQDQQTKLIDDQLPELEHEIRAMNDELVIYLKR